VTELKHNAIGFRSALTIGVTTPAPAYSLATVLGLVVATAGFQAPAVFIAAFVPMLFVAGAFYYLNRADPDCGITFSWSTRALGPVAGFLGGWAILVPSIIVMGLLANTAALYAFFLVGWDAAAQSTVAVTALGVAVIGLVTWLSLLAIEVSARTMTVLLGAQVAALSLFAGVALVKVLAGDAPAGSQTPELSWFSPFAAVSFDAFVDGVLVAIFVFWGFAVALSLNEETSDDRRAPGRAGVSAVLVLLSIYLVVGTCLLAFAGAGRLAGLDDLSLFDALAGDVLGSPLDKVVVLAVITAALPSAQATVIAQARLMMSMARKGALPRVFAHVGDRHRTPDVATWVTGGLAAAWYVAFTAISESFLADSLLAIGLFVAFYHGLTGLACAVYYRRELLRSPRMLLLAGVAPAIGAALFAYVLVRSALDFADPEPGGSAWLGMQPPLVIALALTLLGLVLMAAMRLTDRRRGFFERRAETAPEAA
jgi:amino acid transporter